MVDTNPIINIILKRMITISFRVIELIMEKTCECSAYSYLYNKRVQELFLGISVILSGEPAHDHEIDH